MRILQLITELRPAGAERIVQTLSCGLATAGHEVTVVSLRPLPPSSFVVDRLRAAGIAIHSLEMTKATPWQALRLRRLLRQLRPDVVHAHLIHANLLSRMVRLPGVPVINTVHIAERRPGKGWHFLLDRWTLRRCTVQTCVSRAVAEFLSEKLGSPIQSFPVIQNGIEPPERLSRDEVAALRTEWGVGSDTLLIGSVGRLDWQKGYDRLLKVLAEVDKILSTKSEIQNLKSEISNGEIFRQDSQDKQDKVSPFQGSGHWEEHETQGSRAGIASAAPRDPFSDSRTPDLSTSLPSTFRAPRSAFRAPHSPLAVVLLGDGPEREHLDQQVATLGLRNLIVRMPGFRPDADRAMGAFDVFVMPSRYEGFGLTLVEAMCHGLPVIASDVDSLPELLDGYERGRIMSFVPGHEEEVARAILEMAGESQNPKSQIQNPKSQIPNTKSQISNYGDGEKDRVHHEEHEGHEEINARFHARRMTGEYLRLYESLSAKTKPINPKS